MLWSLFLVLIIVKRLFLPDTFQGSILAVLEFLLLPEILGFVCELSRLNREGYPSSSISMATFLYSQMGYAQRLRLCFLPLYHSVPSLIVLVVVVQSIIYIMIRNKKKHELILLKFVRNSNTTLIKLTSSTAMIVDSDGIKGGSEVKMKLIKGSISEDFSDEMCCMCNNAPAVHCNGTCFHSCLCLGCRIKQKRKMERWTVPLGCPVCRNEGDKHIEIGGSSYKNVMRGVLGKSWNGFHINSTYSFSYLA